MHDAHGHGPPPAHDHRPDAAHGTSAASAHALNRLALTATLHCFTGCSIGEVLGMVLSTAVDLGNTASIALSILLAFVFGYALTMLPLVRGGLPLSVAARLALASDSLSILVMEIVDNALMLVIPGSMEARLGDALFWVSLVASLVVSGFAIYPLNRALIARGRGHALVHDRHGRGPDAVRGEAPGPPTPPRS